MSTPTRRTGDLLLSTPLARQLWPAGTGSGYRIFYRGTGFDQEPRMISGSSFVPAGTPPPDGWPIVAYAHGTVGLADSDAPSRSGLWHDEQVHLAGWLAAGYAVAVTDYEGLGTAGPHPYLNGRQTADDIIDAVRATRQLDHPFDRRWVVVGLSQGAHASLFAADLATGYAPELDFRGSVALAPPSHLNELYARCAVDPDAPVSPLVPILLAGLSVSNPGFDPRDYLPDHGDGLVDTAADHDIFDVLRAGLTLTNVEAGIAEALAHPQVRAVVEAHDIPALRLDRPLYLGQGLADEGIPVDLTDRLAAKLTGAGSEVRYATYPGATHTTVLAAALPDLLAWVDARMADPPAPGTDHAVGRLVSALQRAKLTLRFRRLDTDGSGLVTEADYRLLADRLIAASGREPDSPPATYAREQLLREWRALRRLDTDRDGAIDLEEFVSSVGHNPAGMAAAAWAAAEAVFRLCDTDGGGVLDREEFAAMLAGYRVPADAAGEAFDRLDRDGAVCWEEFAAATAELYTGDDPDAAGTWLLGRPDTRADG